MALPLIPPSPPFQPKQYTKTYWVNPDIGNDNNTGNSIERPWQTLYKALNGVVPGVATNSTVNLSAGGFTGAGIALGNYSVNVIGMNTPNNTITSVYNNISISNTTASASFQNICFEENIVISGSGSATFTGCLFAPSTVVTTSSTGTITFQNCFFALTSGLVVNAGTVVIDNCKISGSVSLSSTTATISNCSNIVLDPISSSTVTFKNTTIASSSTGGVSLITTGTTTLKMYNCNVVDSSGVINGLSLASGTTYTLDDVNFDKSLSTLSGTAATTQTWFNGISATNLTAPASGISGILYYDGTRIVNDGIPAHLGYDAATDTVYTSHLNVSSNITNTAKFINTAANSPTGGSGIVALQNSGSAVTNGSRLGFVTFGGAKDNANTTHNGSLLEGFATQDWTSTAAGSSIVFATTANNTTTRAAALTLGQDKSATFAGTGSFAGNLSVTGDVTATNNVSATGDVIATGNVSATGSVSALTNMTSPMYAMSTLALSNFASGGSIGTAAATVDAYSIFNINQTTSGQNLTLPNPSATTLNREIYIVNVGTQAFTVDTNTSVNPSTSVRFVWNGSNWIAPAPATWNGGIVTNPITVNTVGVGVNVDIAFKATGYNTKGGTDYLDFLQATNTTSGATNPNKFMRLSKTGTIEILNSDYTAIITAIDDSGNIVTPGGLGTGNTVTANGTTAFRAGSNAISNVALEMPLNSAIRDVSNGASNMFFDVSTGGATNGTFQFRSSSSYTNLLTLNTAGANFNSLPIQGQTPYIAKTSWNVAIDTELTAGNYRFRISNQGGIFPQIISNIAGTNVNSAWTSYGMCSGDVIKYTGNTGVNVANNAWSTLYNLHGMDAAGDTVITTVQDKTAGKIFRVTFVRSDNGSTTGYNIIVEQLL